MSLYALGGDVDSLYEYMRALASQELNPMIVLPDILKKILHRIMEDVKSNARLRLCEDPETNIWSYYGTVKLTPIVLQDYLMLIFTIPLVDQSLQVNLYKVYNLPMLHPTLNVHAQYKLEVTYLTTLMEGMFVLLPTALDVKLCLVTNGDLCMLDQALYPVEHINWCIYASFINDQNQIRKDRFLKALNRTTNLVYGLNGYLWAISALAPEKLQIRCVMETHVVTIKPPLQIVDVGNGCKAYSASIYIPAKSELTATLQLITRSQFFLDYNFNYTNVSNFLVWYKSDFAKLTDAEIKTLKVKVLQLPTMSMDMFSNILENIDENYHFSLSPKLILALLITVGICLIALGVIFIWYKRKTTLTSSTMGNLMNLVPSLDDDTPSLNSLLPILSELTSSKTETRITPTTVSTLHHTTPDELTLPPVLIPRLQVTISSPSTSAVTQPVHLVQGPVYKNQRTKHTPVEDTIEPVLLEIFNKAATDLDTKGVINLRKYT